MAGSSGGAVDAKLSVASTPGRLKAKMVLKNTSGKEIVLTDLNPKYFKVEMLDGKAMAFKGAAANAEQVTIKPGGTTETAFALQDSYSFWDRRTKYKIWYDGPDLKSNVVQTWF